MSSVPMKNLVSLVKVLETYRGRDRCIRLMTYVAMFMGGPGRTSAQKKWNIVAAEFGACRVILRLFDDLPMLLFNLSTGFGQKGTPGGILKLLGALSSVLNQLFYPSEHIAWLRQKQILKGQPRLYLLIGLFIWALSLSTEIIRCLIKIRMFGVQAQKLRKQMELDRDGSGQSSPQNDEIEANLKKVAADRKDTMLLLVQTCGDFTNAISWMPPGILWSQKLSQRMNGVFGTIASVIMLYRNWPDAKTS